MFYNTLNPILLNWGVITIRWYGLFLALGVILSVWIIYKLFKQKKYPVDIALDLSVWLIIGGVIGARLGEILFYKPAYYFSHPAEMIMINHGGLSSHGMTIGLLLTVLLFSKIKKISIRRYIDILIIPIPLLAFFIRIGNFFNSEIVGRPTDLPWGVKFPLTDPLLLTRHPVQIYEAILAITIYYLLFTIYKKYSQKLPMLFILHLFFLLYFGARFLIEFTKEYQTSWEGILTAGQWLSIPFIIWGVIYFAKLSFLRKQESRQTISGSPPSRG